MPFFCRMHVIAAAPVDHQQFERDHHEAMLRCHLRWPFGYARRCGGNQASEGSDACAPRRVRDRRPPAVRRIGADDR